MFNLQYSQKEDKYEEEIKILTDKLKEVKTFLFSWPMPVLTLKVELRLLPHH